MDVTTSILIFIGGVIAGGLVRTGLLHRRVSEPIASGLATYVFMLTQHPLMLATGSTMRFIAWAIWCAIVVAVIVVIWADSLPD